jgi:hypothetical protein
MGDMGRDFSNPRTRRNSQICRRHPAPSRANLALDDDRCCPGGARYCCACEARTSATHSVSLRAVGR